MGRVKIRAHGEGSGEMSEERERVLLGLHQLSQLEPANANEILEFQLPALRLKRLHNQPVVSKAYKQSSDLRTLPLGRENARGCSHLHT